MAELLRLKGFVVIIIFVLINGGLLPRLAPLALPHGCLPSHLLPSPSATTYQSPLGLDERPVLPVHLVVEPAGIAQVMASAVASPERGGCGPAVDTLPAF